MLRLTLAALALAFIAGTARAECYYYPNGAVFCPNTGAAPIPSSFGDPNLIYDSISGAGAARVRNQQLQNQILELQLQQMRQQR